MRRLRTGIGYLTAPMAQACMCLSLTGGAPEKGSVNLRKLVGAGHQGSSPAPPNLSE
jgi:hypothetical protein